MKVSIITRIHTSEEYLASSLSSIGNQDFPLKDFEIIIVLDNASKLAIDILATRMKSNMKVIETTGVGLVKAANIGFKNASSDYLILMDSDDIFYADAIRRLYEKAIETGADYVYSDYEELTVLGEKTYVSLEENVYNAIAEGILFKRKVLEELNYYNDADILAEYDLLIKLEKKFKSAYISIPLFMYKRHNTSASGDKNKIVNGLSQLRKRYGNIVDRIRAY